ncbi:MAG TPA: hypothetical protein VKZ97_07085 [Flavobacteriaceae bacterium]|nr:hypothetical protein [Flavobacteriaceae bacterium]
MKGISSFYDNPKKLIACGIISILVGILVPLIWSDFINYAFGMIFGSGIAYLGMGMHKKYSNE